MRKGFTLIELLAVIVILAIIALIATPIVLSIIDDSKESSTIRSAEGYLRAVEYEIAQAYVTANRITEGTFNVLPGGDICIDGYENNECTGNILEIEYNNEGPVSGSITLEEAKITHYTLTYPSGITVVDGKVGDDTINPEDNLPALAKSIVKQAKDNNYYYETTPDFSKEIAAGEYGLYKAADDLGESYYFRGDTENNYVQFGVYTKNGPVIDDFYERTYETIEECENDGGENCQYIFETNDLMYWRIVRINGDGTVRLIYDGTENGEAHIGYTTYSCGYEYDAGEGFIGYTYDGEDSNIKKYIDNWYEAHLKGNYGTYIADGIFCNDREVASTENNYGEDVSWYAPYTRLTTDNNTPAPKLTCTRDEDKYTTNEKGVIGNGLLKNPVGLITADEVAMAGAINDTANKYYLQANNSYWTSSPMVLWQYGVNGADVWSVYGATGEAECDGCLGNAAEVYNGAECGRSSARPVINLKADVSFTGDGSYDTPYVIVTN